MRVNDAVIGLIAILVGIVVFWHVQSFPGQPGGHPGPSLFPSILSALMIIVGCVLIAQGRRQTDQPWFQLLPELNARGIGNIVVTLLAIIFYIAVSDKLGFLLTSFCIMVGMMLLLKTRVIIAMPVAAGTTLGIYAIFHKMLMVPLPRGIFAF